MALVNRISRLFKADLHAVLDQIEEPEQLLKQAIRDMEDDLAIAAQRISTSARDQERMAVRMAELKDAIAATDSQLDLCFASGKDDLARKQVRKKLEAEQLLKRLATKHLANGKYRDEQQAALDTNQATLASLQQKAELFAERNPVRTDPDASTSDNAWMTRELSVDEDEIEIAFLREKSARESS